MISESLFSVDDIPSDKCTALGCSKDAVYRHEKTKHVLVCQECAEQIVSEKNVICEVGDYHYTFGYDAKFVAA